jgi:S-adenosylhomocysteine hydrolase
MKQQFLTYSEELPLLTHTKKIMESPSLEGIAIIGVQHILGSTLEMFKSLAQLGLDYRSVFLLGKCYSSSEEVALEMKNLGINIHESSFLFDSHLSYDELHRKLIDEFLHEALPTLIKKKIKHLVVLDDGGQLILSLNKKTNLLQKIKISGVEQTSAGFNAILNKQLNFPVYNVARSQAKLHCETPIIVESCIDRLKSLRILQEVRDPRLLILGQGAIGLALKDHLIHDGYEVETYDVKMNGPEKLHALIKNASVILGCTGSPALKHKDYAHLKNAILVSTSSSDREFEAWRFRQAFERNYNPLKNYTLGGVQLIQSGFPINFWGSRNNIDLHKIQLTLSLLMLGIFSAIKSPSNYGGIHNLSADDQLDIINAYLTTPTDTKKNSIARLRKDEIIAKMRSSWTQ